jgi:peptide deformylase
MIKPILTEPNHELRLKSHKVHLRDLEKDETQELIDNMIETMHHADGIGLAAPQIGVLKRIIIVDTKKKGPQAFVNPKVTGRSLLRVQAEEGCLSVPGIYGLVKRYRKVTIKAFDRHGCKVKFRIGGMEAIIFQHEIDHLNGMLFTDRVHHFTNPPRM